MSKPMMTPGKTTRCQAITDIIESVALEQAALADILKAEGEKIQKVIELDCVTPCELLDVNASVVTMVDAISRLEMVLQGKLSLFGACLCDCRECKECNDRKDCHRD